MEDGIRKDVVHEVLEDGTCSGCKCFRNLEKDDVEGRHRAPEGSKGSNEVIGDSGLSANKDVSICGPVQVIGPAGGMKSDHVSKPQLDTNKKGQSSYLTGNPELDVPNPKVTDDSNSKTDKERSNDLKKAGIQLDPMSVPTVVSQLMKFLSIKDVKICRLVSTTWNTEASLVILKRGRVCINEAELSKKDQMLQMFCQTRTSRFQKYSISLLTQWTTFDKLMEEIGPHVKKLRIQETGILKHSPMKSNDLRKLLDYQCPNLTSLEICLRKDDFRSCTKLFPSCKTPVLKLQTLKFTSDDGVYPNILTELINVSPELKKLTALSNQSNPLFASSLLRLGCGPAGRQVDFSKLNCLSLTRKTLFNDQAVSIFKTVKWNLSFLKLALDSNVKERTWDAMLKHLSPTLETLIYEDYGKNNNTSLKFPSCMNKLTRIEIETDNSGHFAGPLSSVFSLPKLKTFLLYVVPKFAGSHSHRTNGPDFGLTWRMLELNQNSPKLLSLETLQVPYALTNGEVFKQIATLFPNVKDLRIQHPSEDVLGNIFSSYPNLERLSVRLSTYYWNIDHLVTGLKEAWISAMIKKKQYKFSDPGKVKHQYPGLKHMKKLKYLEIRQKEASYSLSDATLYNGLIYLSNALHLELQGCEFSTEGLDNLKTALGPGCHIEINNARDEEDFWSMANND